MVRAMKPRSIIIDVSIDPVSYTHLRAHETVLDIVCRLLLEKKNKSDTLSFYHIFTYYHTLTLLSSLYLLHLVL